MKLLLIYIVIVFFYSKVSSAPLNINYKSCSPSYFGEPGLSFEFYERHLNKNIKSIYKDYYNKSKRRRNRVYLNSENNFITIHANKEHIIPKAFLEVLSQQIQSALDKGYAEYLFFPDFGHGHLQAEKGMKVNSVKYFFGNNNFIFLYHSVESYTDVPSERMANRNFYGESSAKEVYVLAPTSGKTVFNVPGYDKSNFGFYIQGNRNGCFSVFLNGKPHFFDISI